MSDRIWPTAWRPPHDAPMQISSYMGASCDLPVQLFDRIELLVAILEGTEVDRLLVPETEHAEMDEALVEEPVHAVLERAVEVDHHVAAHDHVELVEGAVGDEVVLREDDVVDERTLELRAVVG